MRAIILNTLKQQHLYTVRPLISEFRMFQARSRKELQTWVADLSLRLCLSESDFTRQILQCAPRTFNTALRAGRLVQWHSLRGIFRQSAMRGFELCNQSKTNTITNDVNHRSYVALLLTKMRNFVFRISAITACSINFESLKRISAPSTSWSWCQSACYVCYNEQKTLFWKRVENSLNITWKIGNILLKSPTTSVWA